MSKYVGLLIGFTQLVLLMTDLDCMGNVWSLVVWTGVWLLQGVVELWYLRFLMESGCYRCFRAVVFTFSYGAWLLQVLEWRMRVRRSWCLCGVRGRTAVTRSVWTQTRTRSRLPGSLASAGPDCTP